MIGVVPTGAVTAAGTDGVGEATAVGTDFSLALTFSINATFVLFDGVETISSVLAKNSAAAVNDNASTWSVASTCADTTPVVTISGDVVGVTTVDGGTSSPVRTLLVVTSTMPKALDLALRDASENLILVTITSIKQMLIITT